MIPYADLSSIVKRSRWKLLVGRCHRYVFRSGLKERAQFETRSVSPDGSIGGVDNSGCFNPGTASSLCGMTGVSVITVTLRDNKDLKYWRVILCRPVQEITILLEHIVPISQVPTRAAPYPVSTPFNLKVAMQRNIFACHALHHIRKIHPADFSDVQDKPCVVHKPSPLREPTSEQRCTTRVRTRYVECIGRIQR